MRTDRGSSAQDFCACLCFTGLAGCGGLAVCFAPVSGRWLSVIDTPTGTHSSAHAAARAHSPGARGWRNQASDKQYSGDSHFRGLVPLVGARTDMSRRL